MPLIMATLHLGFVERYVSSNDPKIQSFQRSRTTLIKFAVQDLSHNLMCNMGKSIQDFV